MGSRFTGNFGGSAPLLFFRSCRCETAVQRPLYLRATCVGDLCRLKACRAIARGRSRSGPAGWRSGRRANPFRHSILPKWLDENTHSDGTAIPCGVRSQATPQNFGQTRPHVGEVFHLGPAEQVPDIEAHLMPECAYARRSSPEPLASVPVSSRGRVRLLCVTSDHCPRRKLPKPPQIPAPLSTVYCSAKRLAISRGSGDAKRRPQTQPLSAVIFAKSSPTVVLWI